MKRPSIGIIPKFGIIVFLLIFSLGCKDVKKIALSNILNKKPQLKIVEGIENVGLAEAILLPQPSPINISRDPFMPLTDKGFLLNSEEIKQLGEGDIHIVGILQTEDKSAALLEFKGETGLFREGDTLGNYTLRKIGPQGVVLESDGKEITLETGGKK